MYHIFFIHSSVKGYLGCIPVLAIVNDHCCCCCCCVASFVSNSVQPIGSSPPGSPVPGILQARTLEWVAISFSNAWKWKVKSEIEVAQSCPTPSDPMDCSLPGSSIHGIFQARVLEWVAKWSLGCCNDHWGTCIFSNYDFLQMYAQEWDCWIVW